MHLVLLFCFFLLVTQHHGLISFSLQSHRKRTLTSKMGTELYGNLKLDSTQTPTSVGSSGCLNENG